MKTPVSVAFGLIFIGFSSSFAFAHPGGLAADGCHTNRKTGDRHCHQGQRHYEHATKNITSVPFANCRAARAAGAAPVYRGDPGYASWLDRDNDGIGCE